MPAILDTLRTRREELEHELKQIDAAIAFFAPPPTTTQTTPTGKGWSPETRAKMSARMKELWRQKRMTTMQPHAATAQARWNPEARARLSARMRDLWKKKKLAAALSAGKASSKR